MKPQSIIAMAFGFALLVIFGTTMLRGMRMVGPPSYMILAFWAVVLTVLLMFVITAVQSRRHLRGSDRRACGRCGAVQPQMANFCRNCGQRLV